MIERIKVSEFESVVVLIGRELDRAFPDRCDDEAQEWLRTIYENRTRRFLADNDAIWKTGAVMIPIAFAAFAIPIQAQIHSIWQIIILGAASCILMGIWILIATNHRAFQDKSMATIVAIEKHIVGYKDPHGPKVNTLHPKISWMIGSLSGLLTNWLLLAILAVGWLILIVSTPIKP